MLRPAAISSRARDRLFQQQNPAFEECARSGSGERRRDGAGRGTGDGAALPFAPAVLVCIGCGLVQRGHREGEVAHRQRSNVDAIHVRQHLRHVARADGRAPRRQLVFVVEEMPQGPRTYGLADGPQIDAVPAAKLTVDGRLPLAPAE